MASTREKVIKADKDMTRTEESGGSLAFIFMKVSARDRTLPRTRACAKAVTPRLVDLGVAPAEDAHPVDRVTLCCVFRGHCRRQWSPPVGGRRAFPRPAFFVLSYSPLVMAASGGRGEVAAS